MERIVDAVMPTPPNVETRRKPSDEQLAHVLESTLIVEPEKNELRLILDLSKCLSTCTFMLTTIPKRIAVTFERIKPTCASCGK